jgi:predicted lipoprotein with Yx(FWY)xxD motif
MRVSTASTSGRSSRFLQRAPLLLLPVALLLFAACGSSGSKAATTNTNAPSSAGTVVMMTNSSKSGALLADAKGMTLYTLTNAGKPVACTGQCATVWPPLLLSSGTTSAKGAAGVSGLGVVSMNGGMQVTEHGDPVYRYSRDAAPGDTHGEGIHALGGVWHVSTTTATATAGTPTTTGTTAPAAGGGGY